MLFHFHTRCGEYRYIQQQCNAGKAQSCVVKPTSQSRVTTTKAVDQAPIGQSRMGGRRRCRFRDLIVAPSYPFDACHHYRPWLPCRKCQNVVSSFVGGRVSTPLAPPLAPLFLRMNEGEGCACGPSGSRRNSGYGPPGVGASLVVWWREAAGIGEAVMMALRCVTH